MRANTREINRITISLPHVVALAANELSAELKVSRSELYTVAMERFLIEQRRDRLQAIAAEMSEEYRTDRVLTELTALDGEEFV